MHTSNLSSGHKVAVYINRIKVELHQDLHETSNNFTGTGDHVPKFLNKLNIGLVYTAGDTLIYCRRDKSLHLANEMFGFLLFFF